MYEPKVNKVLLSNMEFSVGGKSDIDIYLIVNIFSCHEVGLQGHLGRRHRQPPQPEATSKDPLRRV